MADEEPKLRYGQSQPEEAKPRPVVANEAAPNPVVANEAAPNGAAEPAGEAADKAHAEENTGTEGLCIG